MTPSRDLRRVAAEKFGWPRLRDEQLRAMELVMDGHDVLAVLPTGSRKSAIYQVPALLLDGPTLVVSPLIALQHDQIEGIQNSAAPRAVALNSTQRKAEQDDVWESILDRKAEYIFLSRNNSPTRTCAPSWLMWPCRCSSSTRLTVCRRGGTTSGRIIFDCPP